MENERKSYACVTSGEVTGSEMRNVKMKLYRMKDKDKELLKGYEKSFYQTIES